MSAHRYRTTAYNYAHDSSNKVHDDEVAARFGFKGGLVPGASHYAYLSHVVSEAWGDAWLDGGLLEAKFVKPVYEGEQVVAEARADGADRLELVLLNSQGETCSIGRAARRCDTPVPEIASYPRVAPRAGQGLASPDPQSLPAGQMLAAYEFVHDEAAAEAEARALFVEPFLDARGAVQWHPALCVHHANTVVRENVDLGPWVHTASRTCYFGVPHEGEHISVRARVFDTYEKRGHVFTDLDLAIFANEERALVKMFYTAIIRLATR